jgi:RNA polymerase sigma-70 factor (ECF subfamily)
VGERRPAHDGDADLDAWVVAAAPEAVAYAASLLRDRDAAEDVVQDCFCRLLAKADVYDLPRDGRKLLFRSITNACVNVRSRNRPLLRLTDAEEETLPPERVVMHRELEQAVAEGLALLPVTYRAALELKSLGMSLQEIADALDVSANHAGVLVHRARQAMARHLAPFVEDQAG